MIDPHSPGLPLPSRHQPLLGQQILIVETAPSPSHNWHQPLQGQQILALETAPTSIQAPATVGTANPNFGDCAIPIPHPGTSHCRDSKSLLWRLRPTIQAPATVGTANPNFGDCAIPINWHQPLLGQQILTLETAPSPFPLYPFNPAIPLDRSSLSSCFSFSSLFTHPNPI